MDLPKILIDGNEYIMEVPKAKMWRVWMKFDKERNSLEPIDFIDQHAKIIADVFPDVTAGMILDNMPLDEIILVYNKCLKALMGMLSSRLEELAKNELKAESQN